MKLPSITDALLYGLLAALCLVALWLVSNVPREFLNAHVVYQGF